MFSLFNGIYEAYLAPTQLNLLVVGPSGVGKTSLLERLKVTEIPKRPNSRPPTMSLSPFTPSLREAFQQGGSASSLTTPKTLIKQASSRLLHVPPSPVVVVPARRRGLAFICPAPERYRKSKQDQEEDFFEEEKQPLTDGDENPCMKRSYSQEFNADELTDIDDSSTVKQPTNESSVAQMGLKIKESSSIADSIRTEGPPLLQSNSQEYNLKYQKKMFPMSKIRPTIGTNLGKIQMFGAKVSLFDVGGRLQDLWERYYDDCDGVIFCWKLGDDTNAEDDNNDDSDDEFDTSKQQAILNQVRKSIPDDVPFLVFGHVFGSVNTQLTDKIYSTDVLLPHYHNPMTVCACGSAKTGAGFQSAMEWLIPLAKRQKKERVAKKNLSNRYKKTTMW